jgi:hypothetical protein
MKLKRHAVLLAKGLVGVLLLAALLLAWSSTFLAPVTRLNCLEEEVSISTGRVRTTRYLFFLPVRQTIWDSPMTTVLAAGASSQESEQWRRTRTRNNHPHGGAKHHEFGRAVGQIKILEALWEVGRFTDEARRASALKLRQHWLESGDVGPADRLLVQLSELAHFPKGRDQPVSEGELREFFAEAGR